MASRDVEFHIGADVEGLQGLETLARELAALGNEAGESAPEVARLSGELQEIGSQQGLINQFRAQRAALEQTSTALNEARERTQQLALELRNTENPSRSLQNQFERARREVRNLAQAEQNQRLGLQQLRGALSDAGISTRNLAEDQVRLNTRLRETQGEVATLRGRLQQTGNAGEDAGRQIEHGLNQASREAGGLSDGLRNIRDNLVGFFAADQALELAKSLAETADQWAQINDKLQSTTESQEEFNQVQEALFQISQNTRTALAANAAFYAKTDQAVKNLGGSTQEALDLTDAIAKSLRISGASAEEAAQLQDQLAEALNEGALSGDKFNAITGEGDRLLKALADGLGVPVEKLSELAAAGELTSQRIIGALLSQNEVLDKETAKIPLTVGEALEKVENQWLRLIGTQDQATGASLQVAEAISLFADNLDKALAAAVTVGNTATIVTRTVTAAIFGIAATVATALDSLTFGAVDAIHNRAQALRETTAAIGADIAQDFKDIENAWEGVGQAAQKTNQEIEAGTNQATDGLNKAAEAAKQAKFQFEPLKTEATDLSKALQALGIDAQQVTTGIRTEFSALVTSFEEVATGFNAGNQVIDLAAQKLALSAQSAQEAALVQQTLKAQLDTGKLSAEGYAKAIELLATYLANEALAAIKAAESAKELSASLATATQHYQNGLITADQYREAQIAVRDRMNELSGATDKAATATENLKSSMEGGRQAAGQMSQELERTAKAADEVAQSFTSLFLVQREQFRAVSDEAAATYDRMLEKSSRLRQNTTDFFGALKEATEATQDEIDRTSTRYDSLIAQLQSGNGVTEQFLNNVASSTNEFNILGEQKLDALRSEIDSARQKLQQLQDQAEQARESLAGMADQLQDELDQMAGNQEEIENRRYQKQLAQIAELEKAGGEAAQAEAARARENAEQLHKEKLANIQKEKEEKRKADEAQAQREQEAQQRQEEEQRQRQDEAKQEAQQRQQEQQKEREQAEETLPAPKPAPTKAPTEAQNPATPPPSATQAANVPPKQVTKVIRVEFGNNRSLEIPADQEDNLIGFIEMLERAKRVT
jgi:tape measure domain-containing protein